MNDNVYLVDLHNICDAGLTQSLYKFDSLIGYYELYISQPSKKSNWGWFFIVVPYD